MRELSHLDLLEAEAIHVFREVAGQFERSALLFSGGKDSIALLRLAEKAFRPATLPFVVLHIDTGHNFPETLEFRDRRLQELGETLIVRKVEDTIRSGRAAEERGAYPSRNRQQSVTLMDAFQELRLQCAIGGARRDEEKARAKERIFSFRNEFGEWDPKNQRPELWSIYNGRIREGEQIRAFPISNWTELDVWLYIQREKLEVPKIYFRHEREVVRRQDGSWLPMSAWVLPTSSDIREVRTVRFRTVGDMTCTGPIFSTAANVEEVIQEIKDSTVSERGTRADDKRADAAMEDRKREGYF